MELNAVDGQRVMAYRRHLSLGAGRGDLELVRHRDCRERVVAAGLELLGQPREDATAVVADGARLAVDEPLCGTDLAAEGLDQRLVSEADAERRHVRSEPPDDLERRARLARPARPRRDEEMARDQLRGHVR